MLINRGPIRSLIWERHDSVYVHQLCKYYYHPEILSTYLNLKQSEDYSLVQTARGRLFSFGLASALLPKEFPLVMKISMPGQFRKCSIGL